MMATVTSVAFLYGTIIFGLCLAVLVLGRAIQRAEEKREQYAQDLLQAEARIQELAIERSGWTVEKARLVWGLAEAQENLRAARDLLAQRDHPYRKGAWS